MYLSGKCISKAAKLSIGVTIAVGCVITQEARAQAPYLLPYTIQTLAGGGTAVTVKPPATAPCLGLGAVGVTYDNYGDGCQITSSSVVLGDGASPGNVHDVAVDQQGNIYFIDEGSNGAVRRIDARSGVVTMYVGSFVTQSACSATEDKYGDGCPANDGKANASGGYTDIGTARGLSIAKNGDVYIASYNDNIVHRVTAATGLMSYVAGYI